MAADFSGYATKNGLLCADGRTIAPDAFKHQDKMKVPLVWRHDDSTPENILGHAILENRKDGVYTYAYFNDHPTAEIAKKLVLHGDITALSIKANKLVQKAGTVLHGVIREVSLVMAGANPGALIDNVNLAHGEDPDGTESEAIIFTGLELIHEEDGEASPSLLETIETPTEEPAPVEKTPVEDNSGESMNHNSQLEHEGQEKTVADVFNSFTEEQKNVVYYLIGAAVDSEAKHSDEDGDYIQHNQEFITVPRNIFDQNSPNEGPSLSHEQFSEIISDAQKDGSLRDAFLEHAQAYGIQDIDVLFPDAKSISNSPEIIGRRQEWVQDVLATTKHSPFARIKSTAVDLTADEARARGYVKGNLKKEEIIKLLKRVTTPTTVYKKQKLDRDDVIDITDLDIVAWLKAEMRLMLDEEIAAAILVGDGREADDEDKIDEDHLRPIASDADMYAHQVNLASEATGDTIIEQVLRTRQFYKGTGLPTLYTTDSYLTDMILLKDKMGRRLYETEEALAAALRVRKVVPVEAMERVPEVVGIIVNLADYTVGADKGGKISMFDDFDIDYNQHKYLIESRISGALTKPKSAVVIKRALGTLVTPIQPGYAQATHVLTIPTVEGVIYSIDGVDQAPGDITIAETTEVVARPAAGFRFPANIDTDWVFTF